MHFQNAAPGHINQELAITAEDVAKDGFYVTESGRLALDTTLDGRPIRLVLEQAAAVNLFTNTRLIQHNG